MLKPLKSLKYEISHSDNFVFPTFPGNSTIFSLHLLNAPHPFLDLSFLKNSVFKNPFLQYFSAPPFQQGRPFADRSVSDSHETQKFGEFHPLRSTISKYSL